MDRVVKFRGLRTDGKGWVYGFFVQPPIGKCRIYWHPFKEATSNTWHEVTLETVGQFTGLTDSNGKEIYEGDIIKYDGITSYGNEVVREVHYNKDRCQFMAEMYQIECPSLTKSRIIGNIHEKTNKND